MIREAEEKDLLSLLTLYLHLHEKQIPETDARVLGVWESILRDQNHHIIVWEEDGKIVSSCVCVVIPNLTRNVRPYALIENVVTHPDYRRRGLASACLKDAIEIAKQNDCYKIMLLTGAKDEATLNFYRSAGFNSSDKTAFIQWL
ncbi:MAG: GNAT family N-acetyltransferase [Clostridia bacterium]|nr:GNAT family N-acetyltransferase [Clostridia bacterium]